MQVEVKVKCMGTNFGWRGLSGFGDFAPFFCFQNGQNFPSDHEGLMRYEVLRAWPSAFGDFASFNFSKSMDYTCTWI